MTLRARRRIVLFTDLLLLTTLFMSPRISCFLISSSVSSKVEMNRAIHLAAKPSPSESGSEDIFPILRLASAHTASQAMYALVKLGIPDILGDNTLSLSTIASNIGPNTNTDALLRTLRLLTTIDIIEESLSTDNEKEICYRLTKTGSMLQTDHPSSIASCVLHWLEAPLWKSLLALPDFIRGSEIELPFEKANGGVSSDNYYNQEDHPESLKNANDFVRRIYDEEIESVLSGFDWEAFSGKRVLDIGGHHGKVVGAIKNKYPAIKAMSLDLPEVIESAPSAPKGVTLVKGDIMDPSTIPPCDVILLKHFLDRCMWDEDQTVQILKSCRKALPADGGGKVVIAETVVPDIRIADSPKNPKEEFPLYMDAMYMVVGRERQRTKSEWHDLASKSGFEIEKITTTNSPTCSMLVLAKTEG